MCCVSVGDADAAAAECCSWRCAACSEAPSAGVCMGCPVCHGRCTACCALCWTLTGGASGPLSGGASGWLDGGGSVCWMALLFVVVAATVCCGRSGGLPHRLRVAGRRVGLAAQRVAHALLRFSAGQSAD
eukprot:jgi/Ulvmu1/11807/UM080_0018.1